VPADFLGLCRTTLRDAIDQLSSPPATPSPKCRCSAGPRRTVAPNPDGRVEQRSIHYNPIRLQRTMSGVVNVLHIPHYASIAGPRRTISEHPARTWSIAPTAWGTPHPKKTGGTLPTDLPGDLAVDADHIGKCRRHLATVMPSISGAT
jgi:hypothetical protein